MEVIIKREGVRTVASLSGRVDSTNAEQFRQDMMSLAQDSCPDVEIDCGALDYTSSLGLRTFLSLQKSVSAKGGRLVLKNMQDRVKEVFDITGFSNVMTIE